MKLLVKKTAFTYALYEITYQHDRHIVGDDLLPGIVNKKPNFKC